MAGSAMWIKQNMLATPPPRAITEAEIRVQRALQKLEIPEWYLNKHSKAPKILRNNTPVEYREASWKRGTKPEKLLTNSLIEKSSDPTGIYRTNKKLKTSMDESLFTKLESKRMIEDSINENSLSMTSDLFEENESIMKNSEPMTSMDSSQLPTIQDKTFLKSPRRNFSLNKSYTFPTISPSRKVQNINIVFPTSTPPPVPSETTLDSSMIPNSKSGVGNMNETYDSVFGETFSYDEKFRTPRGGKRVLPTSCFKTNLANAISPKPFSKRVETSFDTSNIEFNVQANSTAIEGKFAPPILQERPEDTLNGNSLENTKYSDWRGSTYWIGEVTPVDPECKGTCEECGAKPPRIFAAVTRMNNGFKNVSNEEYLSNKFRKIMGISGVSLSSTSVSSEDKPKDDRSPSPQERLSNTNSKTIELGSIIKSSQLHHGKNLVQEIIKGLKDKCTMKSKTNYASTRTKHFVKMLVNDLQAGYVADVPEEEEVESEEIDGDIGSGSGSDLDLNSAALSTSISLSFKDSDSGSDCGPVTSTLKSNAPKPLSRTESPSEETDGVYWIPIQRVNLPRTSSLMSMMSKRSGSSISQSPSISPISLVSDINQADETIFQNFCETTDSKQHEIMKKLFKIDEAGVLDSGYSDRSSVRSCRTESPMSDRSWFDESELTPPESEKSFSRNSIKDRIFWGKKSGVYIL